MMDDLLRLFFVLASIALLPHSAASSFPVSSSQNVLSVVSDCDPVLNISCFSSCSFTSHCWGMKDGKSPYITCSWNALKTQHQLQYSAIIQDTTQNYCSPTVSCEQSTADDMVTCRTIILSNVTKCNFILKGGTALFSVNILNDDEPFCTSLARFKPCDIVKLDSPTIDDIIMNENLEIRVSPPQCATNSWTSFMFVLRYSAFNGISSSPDKYSESPPFVLPLFDAQEYNISVYVAVEEVSEVLRVWSDPQEETYLTSPISATDNDFIFYQCMKYGSSSSIVATWQKTGVVSGFDCRLTDVREEDSFLEYYVGRESQLQTVFEVQFNNLNEDEAFSLSIAADNPKGRSQPTLVTIAQTFCDNSGKNPGNCRSISGGPHWMEVAWSLPVTSSAYDKFKVSAFSSATNMTSSFLPSKTTLHKLTNMQSCVLYTVVVESYYSSIKVGHCMFQTFTKEIAPIGSPTFQLINKSDSSITIQIDEMLPSQRCGSVASYQILYSADNVVTTISSPTSSATITGLRPYSNYSLQVAAVNQAGRGPFSSSVVATTGQAAPSTPPFVFPPDPLGSNMYLIEWQQPDHPNGLISLYIMFVFATNSSELVPPSDRCIMIPGSMECRFEPTQHDTTMELYEGATIQMQACTDKGLKCSEKSLSVEVVANDPFPILLTVLLSCLFLLLASLAFCYFYMIRSRGFKVKGPKLHSKILREMAGAASSKADDVISPGPIVKCAPPGDDELYESVQVWRGQGRSDAKAEASSDGTQDWGVPASDTSNYVTEHRSSLSDRDVNDATHENRGEVEEDYVGFPTNRALPGNGGPTPHSVPFQQIEEDVVFSPSPRDLHPTYLPGSYPHEVYFPERSADSGVSSLLRRDDDSPTSPTQEHFFPSDVATAYTDWSPTERGLLRGKLGQSPFLFSDESVI